jgi:hypothetical protein
LTQLAEKNNKIGLNALFKILIKIAALYNPNNTAYAVYSLTKNNGHFFGKKRPNH